MAIHAINSSACAENIAPCLLIHIELDPTILLGDDDDLIDAIVEGDDVRPRQCILDQEGKVAGNSRIGKPHLENVAIGVITRTGVAQP